MTHDLLGLPIGRGVGLEARPGLWWGRVQDFGPPPSPPHLWHSIRRWKGWVLRREAQVWRRVAKTPSGCYSGAAALGKQISFESEESWTSGKRGRWCSRTSYRSLGHKKHNVQYGHRRARTWIISLSSCKSYMLIPLCLGSCLLWPRRAEVVSPQNHRIYLSQFYSTQAPTIMQKHH